MQKELKLCLKEAKEVYRRKLRKNNMGDLGWHENCYNP